MGVHNVQRVALEALLELRERVLTPGHPGRPVIWPSDTDEALHYGMSADDRLVGCASVTPEARPGRPAARPFHLHSMAMEPDEQGRGLGRALLRKVIDEVVLDGGDLLWATARLSAVDFYRRCGFQAGEVFTIAPTNAPMQYVWATPQELAQPSGSGLVPAIHEQNDP